MIDIDWNAPTRGCETPGCNHPTWHVCLIGKPDLIPNILKSEAAKKSRGNLGPRSDAYREAIAEGQRKRWDKAREKNKERDAAIVKRYSEALVSMNGLAREFGIGRNAIMVVLKAAETRGEVQIRPRGTNIRYSKD